GRVLVQAADAAVRQGGAGRKLLPADLQPAFDALVQAFAHAEAGRDDDARTALQAIGLGSPFLEWKLLLRGLLAYWTGDDARALDNWQRLDASRLPGRLAAPFRAALDPAYRTAQSPAARQFLQQWLDQRQNSELARPLQVLRQNLGNPDKLAQALKQVEGLL